MHLLSITLLPVETSQLQLLQVYKSEGMSQQVNILDYFQ